MNCKQLKEVADKLFSKRTQYMTLCQELAENFYPQRADFTLRRDAGDEYMENLMTSYPVISRRTLGDQIGVMLRPTDKEWFKIVPEDEDRASHEAKQWLDWATKRQRRAMYNPLTKFERAVKEGDHDFATFGQCVIQITPNRFRNNLLYRSWHLRDVCWQENDQGDIGFIVRKWKCEARDMVRLFPKAHENVKAKADKQPFEKICVYHIICEADMVDENAKGKPFFSIYYDADNDHELEKLPVYNKEYVIPRWQTVSGSQYAYSPAAITALPDARMIQAMTYTLLEAGEKAVNPPLVATQDAVRSDIAVYAGGVTWIDGDYDERLGQALRPIASDHRNIPLGMEMSAQTHQLIHQAFFLNKLTMPERGPEMTAYEVAQRLQEYIRGAIPIFSPMEPEYNGAICEQTFDLMMRMGAFGSPADIPQSLQGADVRFKFESPLHDAIEEQKGQKFLESNELLAQAAALDPNAPVILDVKTALRDVLTGIGTPAEWLHSEDEVEAVIRQREMEIARANQLAAMQQGAEVADKLASAQQKSGQEIVPTEMLGAG